MRIFYFIFILLQTPLLGYSQATFEKAVLLSGLDNQNKFNMLINDHLKKKYSNNSEVHLYSWNDVNKTVQKGSFTTDAVKPINHVKYASFALSGMNLKPDLEITTDTTGKTTSVFYKLNPQCYFQSKTIEVKSSKIIAINGGHLQEETIGIGMGNEKNIINIPKFLEEFGGNDPSKLRKMSETLFENYAKKINEKYASEIEKRYLSYCSHYAGVLERYLIYFPEKANEKSFKVIKDLENDDKKIKYIRFEGSKKDNLTLGNGIYLYEIVDFEVRKSTKYISSFSISEIGDTLSTAKLITFGNKKKIAELLKSTNELLLFNNTQYALAYNKSLNKNLTEYNVAVRKKGIFDDINLETNMLNIPILNIIERNAPEMKIFQEMVKLGKFIDYNSEELVNKQLGVKYLFYRESGTLMSTDIETGKIIGSEGNSKQYVNTIIKNLFFDTFNYQIEFLKTMEISKGKVKEVAIYSDFGFEIGEKIIIYTTEDEKVGNKILKRKVVIGEGYIKSMISDFICNVSIREGGKELFELQNQNKPFYIEYKIK